MSESSPPDNRPAVELTPAQKFKKTVVSLLVTTIVVMLVSTTCDSILSRFETSKDWLKSWNQKIAGELKGFHSSPADLKNAFFGRFSDEHGWRLLSWAAPFNITQAEFNFLKSHDPNFGQNHEIVSEDTGRPLSRIEIDECIQVYRIDPTYSSDPELAAIKSSRLPGATTGPEQFDIPWVSYFFALPDALMHTISQLFHQSAAGVVIGLISVLIAFSLGMSMDGPKICFFLFFFFPIYYVLAYMLGFVAEMGAHSLGSFLSSPLLDFLGAIAISHPTFAVVEHHVSENMLRVTRNMI